jgi:hypothetical protein
VGAVLVFAATQKSLDLTILGSTAVDATPLVITITVAESVLGLGLLASNSDRWLLLTSLLLLAMGTRDLILSATTSPRASCGCLGKGIDISLFWSTTLVGFLLLALLVPLRTALGRRARPTRGQ